MLASYAAPNRGYFRWIPVVHSDAGVRECLVETLHYMGYTPKNGWGPLAVECAETGLALFDKIVHTEGVGPELMVCEQAGRRDEYGFDGLGLLTALRGDRMGRRHPNPNMEPYPAVVIVGNGLDDASKDEVFEHDAICVNEPVLKGIQGIIKHALGPPEAGRRRAA